MSPKYTIKLSQPIEAHGEEVTELHLRRPKLKDLKGISLDNITGDLMIDLVAKLAGIPPTAAGEIDAADFDVIGEAFNVFFPQKMPGGSEGLLKSVSDTASE